MALGMCRTKFYARAFLLKSYRAHQRYFQLCELAKRVAHRRLHQHCRGVSEQHRTTRSGLQMQALTTYNSSLNGFNHSNMHNSINRRVKPTGITYIYGGTDQMFY